VALSCLLAGPVPAALAAQEDAAPPSPFRCAVSWNDSKVELTIFLENTSGAPLMSDGVASLTLVPPGDASGATRYVAPINLETGKAAALGETASLNLESKETRTLAVGLRTLRWARQIRGLRPSLDTMRKVVPPGSYELTLRLGSVLCKPPEGALNVSP
jgi:hypothetical protein